MSNWYRPIYTHSKSRYKKIKGVKRKKTRKQDHVIYVTNNTLTMILKIYDYINSYKAVTNMLDLPSGRYICTLLILYGFPKSTWSRVCVWFILFGEQSSSLKFRFQSLANDTSLPLYVEFCNTTVGFLLERISVHNKRNI